MTLNVKKTPVNNKGSQDETINVKAVQNLSKHYETKCLNTKNNRVKIIAIIQY